jgi:hypothetical protein
VEHHPTQDRAFAGPSAAAISRAEKPDGPAIAPAARAPTPPDPVSAPPAAPHRRAGPLLPLMMIAVLLGLALLSLTVSLHL